MRPRTAAQREPAAPAERLQKVLARAGLGSRRALETLIAAGEVTVDGRPARLGEKVTAASRITVRGRPVSARRLVQPPSRVIGLNKPVGVVSTRSDPAGRRTVVKLLPRPTQGRWAPVGRLDINSAGLLLFATDGELAHRLMHPSAGVEREYAVRVYGRLDEAAIARLCAGVELEDGVARVARLEPAGGEGANRWYRAVLREGRYRELRRLFAAAGVQVSRLIRVRYGPVSLPAGLKTGRCFEVDAAGTAALYQAAGLTPPGS